MKQRSEPMRLFDQSGHRKYLTAVERERFVEAAKSAAPEIECLCLVLHHTGCRLSEALGLEWAHVDFDDGTLILQTLKQRQRDVYRVVPIPPILIARLKACRRLYGEKDGRVFPWHRATAWEKIKAVMHRAGINGLHACPRGIRHGFGIAAVTAGIPVTLVQRWLGHSKLETTAIYLGVVGHEERRFAAQMWREAG